MQSEAVVFIRAMETGKLELNYSHHVTRTRPTSSGSWSGSQQARLPLSPQLIAMIQSYAGVALFDYFLGRVRVFPALIGSPLESVKW